MMKDKKHYNSLLDLINEYVKNNCKFILDTKEYKDLDNYFQSFFGDNFKYGKINKLYYNCFIYQNYIIKFSDHKSPLKIPKTTELVKSYIRKNITFKTSHKTLYLGLEIQDYLYPNKPCSIEELYLLYQSLREKGYIWMDANLSNAVKYQNKPIIVDTDYIYHFSKANYTVQSLMSKTFAEKYEAKKH